MKTDDESILAGPREQVFRETLLCRASPEDRAALARVTRMVYEFVDTHEPKLPDERHVYAALRAASRDIRSLRDFLFETAEVYESNNETGTSGIVLSELAKSYARKLAELQVGSIGI